MSSPSEVDYYFSAVHILNPMTGYFNEPAPALRFYCNTGTPQNPRRRV
ncbi:hypothetical protein [Kamptonema formosum]|nr:hypothetical protein [Oscillatoria sp. PCC 10802]